MPWILRPFSVLIVLITSATMGMPSWVTRADDPSPASVVHRVLFVGIDGCRFDVIEAAETPNLKELRKDGVWSPAAQILGRRYQKNDTCSGPGWSSILTGVWADKHGVHDNDFKTPDYQRYPHFFQRLKQVRPGARTVSIVTWAPIADFIVSAADVSLKFTDAANDYARYDAAAADAAIAELKSRDPDVLFLYFGQVDEFGHQFGFHPTVPEYKAAIERVDRHLGDVLQAMRGRPNYAREDWLVVVTSDHGGSGKGHSGGHTNPEILNSFLIVSGASATRGRLTERVELVDAPVTVLAHLGVAPAAEWRLDGRPVGLATEYPDHAQLLVHRDATGQFQPIDRLADWSTRRQHILEGMQRAMGTVPDPGRRVPLMVEVVDEAETPKYVRRKLTYQVEPRRRAHAYLLVPKQLHGRAPAVLALHPTHDSGAAQVVGLAGNPTRFYAHELAERGFVVLAPDYPSFGDEKPFDLGRDPGAYASGTMRAIWDNIRGVDLLESRPEVDPQRVGVIGHSLGGHNALFTAVFEPRLKAVVTSCGFTAFHRYYQGNLKGWTSDRYMPRIRDLYGLDPRRVPFDFHEVLAAIAPRPVRVVAPLGDHNFDNPGVREVVDAARKIYALHEAAEALDASYPDYQHDFPDDARQAVYEWLARQL